MGDDIPKMWKQYWEFPDLQAHPTAKPLAHVLVTRCPNYEYVDTKSFGPEDVPITRSYRIVDGLVTQFYFREDSRLASLKG